VVRNSVEELTGTALTFGAPGAPAFTGLGFDGLDNDWAAVEEVTLLTGVEMPLEGPEPGACWISLPCSDIKAGASFCRLERIWGRRADRIKALTGSFAEVGLWISMSNWGSKTS
jgi:hypothetical protein